MRLQSLWYWLDTWVANRRNKRIAARRIETFNGNPQVFLRPQDQFLASISIGNVLRPDVTVKRTLILDESLDWLDTEANVSAISPRK